MENWFGPPSFKSVLTPMQRAGSRMAKYTYVQYIASAGVCIVNIVDHHIVDTLLKKRCTQICSVKQAIWPTHLASLSKYTMM